MVQRLAGLAIPQHSRFALVGSTDRSDVAGCLTRLGQRFPRHRELGRPDVIGVVLDKAGLRKDLAEFALGQRDDAPVGVKDDRA